MYLINCFLNIFQDVIGFSSPFIEERLYLVFVLKQNSFSPNVLVPFYRGAVVFSDEKKLNKLKREVLVPFYRGAVVFFHKYW